MNDANDSADKHAYGTFRRVISAASSEDHVRSMSDSLSIAHTIALNSGAPGSRPAASIMSCVKPRPSPTVARPAKREGRPRVREEGKGEAPQPTNSAA